MDFLINYTHNLTRKKTLKNYYHTFKIIENICEKENNGPKGVIVEKKKWFENKLQLFTYLYFYRLGSFKPYSELKSYIVSKDKQC